MAHSVYPVRYIQLNTDVNKLVLQKRQMRSAGCVILVKFLHVQPTNLWETRNGRDMGKREQTRQGNVSTTWIINTQQRITVGKTGQLICLKMVAEAFRKVHQTHII